MKLDGKTKHKVKISGKLSFSNLPQDVQDSIKERLAEQDPTMAKGINGELPGIKIDGKVVTKDNIGSFKKVSGKVSSNKLTEKQAYKLNKNEQVDLLNKLGINKIPKFEKSRVKLILELQ